MARRLSTLALALASTLGCVGSIEMGAQTGAAGGGAGTGAPPLTTGASGATGSAASTCTPSPSLAPARIWRLTDEQYGNVVAQVFGVRVPAEITQADAHPDEFSNFSEAPELTVQSNTVSAYQTMAHRVAQAAATANAAVFLPCGAAAPTDACVEQFVRNRVARAFGRPLTSEETADLLNVFRAGRQESVTAGVRLVIEAALQSPSFLYRTELGAPGSSGKAALTPFELAGAVAFALLDSVPDDGLWARAQDGTLTTPAVLGAEVDRLLATPAVQANLAAKASYWLGVEKVRSMVPKNTALFPEFTAHVKADLYDSARLFVRDLMTSGKVSDLLTSRRMYLNERLAKVYGVPGVSGAALTPIEGPADSRGAGILTQPAVLAAWSHPDRGDVVHRGLFVYNALVCGNPIPPPPANATAVAAGFPKDATERQLADLRATNAAGCGACHAIFDPFGLATEQYDPIGRFTPTDAAGKAIDASTTLKAGGALTGPVSGLDELVTKLNMGRRLSDCAARNMAPFVLGKTVITDQSCALAEVKDRFAESGSFPDFFRAMLTSPGFLTRDVAP
jgi:hypothetical protein